MDETKQNKLIIKRLLSSKTEEVLFTINKLRNTGNKNVVPFLIEILATHKDEKVKESILKLLFDLKYQSAADGIVKGIKSDKYAIIHKDLLQVCWQSTIDFSMYVDVFVEMFIKGDFEECFEAFTVIENIETKIDAEMVDNSIAALKFEINNIEENKKELLIGLVHILENLKKTENRS
ncbi:MAG: hypothetical protein B6I20_03610 [Bacteroidetes bacterium 4572_117]|nr:MAG: hypothetical protein B6I20_03610 [Bacteroidetes bacterium 4572_117]